MRLASFRSFLKRPWVIVSEHRPKDSSTTRFSARGELALLVLLGETTICLFPRLAEDNVFPLGVFPPSVEDIVFLIEVNLPCSFS